MKQGSDERSAHWQQHINHCEASGLSAAQYCQEHQLAYHCFIYWRSKFADLVRAKAEKPDGHAVNGKALSAFVAARPQASPATDAITAVETLQLALPNGLIIQNIRDGNLSTVRALLERL